MADQGPAPYGLTNGTEDQFAKTGEIATQDDHRRIHQIEQAGHGHPKQLGGFGNDTLDSKDGQRGNDVLDGGQGNDRFIRDRGDTFAE